MFRYYWEQILVSKGYRAVRFYRTLCQSYHNLIWPVFWLRRTVTCDAKKCHKDGRVVQNISSSAFSFLILGSKISCKTLHYLGKSCVRCTILRPRKEVPKVVVMEVPGTPRCFCLLLYSPPSPLALIKQPKALISSCELGTAVYREAQGSVTCGSGESRGRELIHGHFFSGLNKMLWHRSS